MKKITDLLDFRSGSIKRQRDGLVKTGKIGFVEWDGNDQFKDVHPEPKKGYSIMVDFHRFSYAWLTTKITEIGEDGLTIKTKNSIYEIKYDER